MAEPVAEEFPREEVQHQASSPEVTDADAATDCVESLPINTQDLTPSAASAMDPPSISVETEVTNQAPEATGNETPSTGPPTLLSLKDDAENQGSSNTSNPSSEEKVTEPQNSVLGRLTVEQLLDYVKKQNAKVKKLKLENDEIRSQLSTVAATEPQPSGDGFWREIHNRPEWQRQLARGVLAHLLYSFQIPKNLLTQLRRAFLHWHRLSTELHTSVLKKQLTEASETQTQLEQRVSKLKTLLSRMHQSNQKNVEDTVLARKNQLEIALEYQQRMTQEEAEKQALEEQLRCLAFESALHSDMEFMIEKAAQQIASQKSDNLSESSQALKFFELQQQIGLLEKELAGSKELVQTYESRILHQSERILSLERQLERSKENEERSKSQISFLQNQSTELEIARQDLEVELKILVGNRTNVAAEIEARASAKASQMLKALETNLNETQTAMESWEKRALISESREERQNREIKILRKQVTDFQVIQSENENLVKIVREMKKSLGSAQELQGGGHPPVSPIDVAVIESERNLLKKIQQESMLIVERESFQHILRQAEMHERSLLSTSQHLTFFDNELHFLKKKSLTLTSLLSTSHLLRSEQDQLLNTIFNSLSLNTLRHLDSLLGFESLPTWEVSGITSPGSDVLLVFTSEPYRQKYNSILQNIDNLDTLLFLTATSDEGSTAAVTNEELFLESASSVLPSLFDHSPHDDSSSSMSQANLSGGLISERYQQALVALRSQSQTKSLTAVYLRILKKIKKTEEQLEEHVRSVESAKASVEAASNAVSICLASGQGHRGVGQLEEPIETPPEPSLASLPIPLPSPVVTVYPHHLKWEAIDIKIPAGGMVTLPLPVPLLPRTSPKDSELLILSKELSVSWAIRSSSSSYAQVSISAPNKRSPQSQSQTPHFDRLRSELISSEEVTGRGIQFGYVRSHEDVLSRIGETVVCGEHIIRTSDGNRVMEISNRAVWATITISYQVRIDNYVTNSLPTPLDSSPVTNSDAVAAAAAESAAKVTQTTLERKAKRREEHLAHLKALQDELSVKQETLSSLQQKQISLESRLHSMSGPLLLLRETFKTGIFLREKFCAQWQHWLAVREVFLQNQETTLTREAPAVAEESCSSLSLTLSESTAGAYEEQPVQSVWLQDLELIQKMIESHHELCPLSFAQIFPQQSSPGSPSPFLCSPPTSPHSTIAATTTIAPSASSHSFSETAQVEELSLAQEIPHSPPLSLPQPLPRDTLPDRILLSSSNLKIRPSSDFRCPIKIPRHISPDVLFTLSWDFTLLSLSDPPSSSAAAAATAASSDGSSSSAIDIGFCVLGKSADGSFPLLTPYRRIGPVGTNVVGSLSFLLTAAEDDDQDEEQQQWEEGEVMRIPYSEVILLFDNTYSWFKPKHIRYEISLDCSGGSGSLSAGEDDSLPIVPSIASTHQPLTVCSDESSPTPAPALAPLSDSTPEVEKASHLNEDPTSAPARAAAPAHSFPLELLAEVAGASSRILQLSDEIHEFCASVTSLTYK